ncbi:hypothetical protein LPJ79_002824 [Coemansia sp. RSA 1821]|nr:hypothetical protein LPJ79_002824 [Coemansia sp. RSA 1821]
MTENEILPYVNIAKSEKQRAQWSVDGDYLFVKILAEHAECSAKHGLKMNHCPIDSAIINEVASGLNNNMNVDLLAQELAAKYPNKKLEGRSADSINLLISLKHHMPQFTYRQLNSKHTNMCTRTIIPFHDIIDIERPFKSKTIFDKDCKRFVKVIVEFYSYVISYGINSVDLNLYVRKSGKGSKLLEQWLTAMLNTHKQNMVNFLYACGVKLASAYIKSKQPASRTFEEARFLESQSFPPKIVQMILREYIDHIAKNEIDDAALGMPVTQSFKDPDQEGAGNNPELYSPEPEYRAPHASVSLQQPIQSPAAVQKPTLPPYSYRPREGPRYQPYPHSRQAAYAGGAQRPSIGNEMYHARQSPCPETYSRQYRPIRNPGPPHTMRHPAYVSQHAMPPMKPAYVTSHAPGRVSPGAQGPDIHQQSYGYYQPMPLQGYRMSPRYGYPATSAVRPPPSFSINRFHPYAQPSPVCRDAKAYESADSKTEPQMLHSQQNSISLSPQTMPTDIQSLPDTKSTSVPVSPTASKLAPNDKSGQAESDIQNKLETLQQLFGDDTKKRKVADRDTDQDEPVAVSKRANENATFNGAAKGLRAHWSAELDYRFVKTLAEHTICNEQDGIVFKHKYADSDIIEDVTRDIANKKPIQAIVHDLAIKFPNKIEQHRSRECIELLLTLQGIIPEFNFQQINNKHINMWTRVIVPFRQVFDCGTLYKGKSMLHKDCKRFTKAIMEFITSVSSKGINNVDYNIFRKPGKGSKLLEQWMTAMLHTHKMDMVKFLIACGARLAFTYLKSRPADSLTFNEQNYLKTASHSPKEILVVLKSYMDDIIRQENIDSLADLGVVSEIMRESPQSFHNQGSVYSGHHGIMRWIQLPDIMNV